VTRFKDLCVDVSDAREGAAFLAPLLGLDVVEVGPDGAELADGVAEHTLWVNVVPEPRTVKNRVHLDVDVASVEEVLLPGVQVVDDSQPWTVLSGDQVGEFCAFVRPPERLSRYRLYEVCVDCADAERVATWWAAQLEVTARSERGFWWFDGAPGMPWEMVFNNVPEPKTVKNRVHWDVWGSTEELVAAGARVLRPRDDEIGWDVLADPEGNEFCVFTPR
jgi:hypothetical protein